MRGAVGTVLVLPSPVFGCTHVDLQDRGENSGTIFIRIHGGTVEQRTAPGDLPGEVELVDTFVPAPTDTLPALHGMLTIKPGAERAQFDEWCASERGREIDDEGGELGVLYNWRDAVKWMWYQWAARMGITPPEPEPEA